MSEEPVNKEICELKHSNINKDIGEIKDGMGNITASVQELAIISAKLTQLVEIQSKSSANTESRVNALEDTQAKTLGSIEASIKSMDHRVTALETRKKFWETKLGDWIVKAGIVLVFIVVLAAIGRELNSSFLESIFGG